MAVALGVQMRMSATAVLEHVEQPSLHDQAHWAFRLTHTAESIGNKYSACQARI
jgi:hypothetical protein